MKGLTLSPVRSEQYIEHANNDYYTGNMVWDEVPHPCRDRTTPVNSMPSVFVAVNDLALYLLALESTDPVRTHEGFELSMDAYAPEEYFAPAIYVPDPNRRLLAICNRFTVSFSSVSKTESLGKCVMSGLKWLYSGLRKLCDSRTGRLEP